jgi:hypothetical protein
MCQTSSYGSNAGRSLSSLQPIPSASKGIIPTFSSLARIDHNSADPDPNFKLQLSLMTKSSLDWLDVARVRVFDSIPEGTNLAGQ